ncbi:MAG: hypothetical protein V4671_14300, partial [Armatimonadota bacterium]
MLFTPFGKSVSGKADNTQRWILEVRTAGAWRKRDPDPDLEGVLHRKVMKPQCRQQAENAARHASRHFDQALG